MAYTGQTIENPISGERNGHVPRAHVHPEQEERFEIVSGTMKLRMNGKKIVAGPGDIVTVPPGARHKFANGGDEPVEVRRPPSRWSRRSPPALGPPPARHS